MAYLSVDRAQVIEYDTWSPEADCVEVVEVVGSWSYGNGLVISESISLLQPRRPLPSLLRIPACSCRWPLEGSDGDVLDIALDPGSKIITL